MTDIKFSLWFAMRSSRKLRLARKLYNVVGDAEKIYRLTESDYINIGITDIEYIALLCDKRMDDVMRELFFAEQYRVEFITIESKDYPEMLRHIADPPLLLYKRGDYFPTENKLCIAIVGTRKSKKGNDVAFNIARDLSLAGVTVVAGMAEGIDTMAHNGAIAAGGKTIAVLGCGVNRVYPASNKNLCSGIMNNGCLISEYCFDTPPNRYHFPERNRIISGICHGVVVVEAPKRSGALNTASHAAEQGRDVFAFPGNENDLAFEGCRYLIDDGAKKVNCVKDILEEYSSVYPMFFHKKSFNKNNVEFEIPQAPTFASVFADAIIDALKEGPATIDRIAAVSKMPMSKLNGHITLLELEGKIIRVPGTQVFKLNE